ncbi:DUF1707 and FHA domain-containing protein [Rhizohabitans arisaemae]|uniref:DUF1707 and FHA domain-containing protein n=1 Tax=Rhizohabitans arisaemae TaxID=2720610 RepID=UPI0024B173DB|nr:DUF1707 and FHA domain-containing protein [Rhizohabitans arisaemae]
MSSTYPPVRASDGDRDRAISELRDRAVEGQLSHETFVGRIDMALRARHRGELDQLVADLPPRGRFSRFVTDKVGKVSEFVGRVASAWRKPRLQRLALPSDTRTVFSIGRAPTCDLVLGDLTVSRRHAELRHEGESWLVVDLGSMNGTRLNGWRLLGPALIRPGDEISFGDSSFVLAGR